MRTVILATSVLIVVSGVRADDPAAVVEKAIQATATSELRLQRLTNVVRTDRGTLFLPGGNWLADRVAYFALPDRLKYEATMTVAGQKQATIMALNGPLGWHHSNGQLVNLTQPQADALKEGDLTGWALLTLRPLREKGAKLKSLPDTKINGKAAVGVTLSKSGRPDAQFYFDAATDLPLRITFQLREGGADSRQQDLDVYKAFDGIRLPTQITVWQNRQKIEEWTVLNYKFPDRLADKLFVKP